MVRVRKECTSFDLKSLCVEEKSDDVGGKAQVRMTRGKVSAAPNDLKAGVVKESSGKSDMSV